MRKITGLMITVEEIPNSELHEIVVVACNATGDVFTTKGLDLEEAWTYARMMQEMLGLPEDYIECDVFDIEPPKLHRIK